MEVLLFSERSLWTMLHGIVLGGGGILGLAAVLFALYAMREAPGSASPAGPRERAARLTGRLAAATAALLWLAVIGGTYVVFPPYRATPPEGATDLAAYPRSLIRSEPDTAWLHSFAMESKEHVPWIAAMLATAAAFVLARYRGHVLTDAELHRITVALVATSFVLASWSALLGVWVNKVAPVQ